MRLYFVASMGPGENHLVRILLADDHSLLRETMSHALRHKKGDVYAIIAEAKDAQETLLQVDRHRPDLALLDYQMPGVGRLSTFCEKVIDQSPNTRILVLSGFANEEIAIDAAKGGAHGYMLKGTPFADLVKAIDTIQAGGFWVDPQLPPQVFQIFLNYMGGNDEKLRALSRRELKILSLLAEGLRNKEIGRQVQISEKTVKNHLTHIFAKLGVEDREQAVRYFLSAQKAA